MPGPISFTIDKREIGKAIRIGLAALDEKLRERERVRLGWQRRAVAARQLDDATPALRLAHDAANARAALRLEELRDRDVARDHEILDQVARVILVHDLEVDDLAVLRDRRRLDRLELERAVAHALGLEPLRRLVLELELLGQHLVAGDLLRRRARRRARRRRRRRRASRGCEPSRGRRRTRSTSPLRVDHRLDRDREAVLAFVERRAVRRQLFGQHRKDVDAGVDRRAVGERVLVDRRALRHERIDVGDGDDEPDIAVGQPLRDLDLVEIARLVVVDRRPGLVAQVLRRRVDGRGRCQAVELLRASRR